MVLLGLKKDVLSSDFIWLCAQCYTCSERCPQDVKITDLMNALKNIAVREGYIPDWLKKQVEILKTNTRLLEIGDFENERRQKINLPSIKVSDRTKQDLKTLFETV
jgi:heterodisulfide reductase subunit C